ncbi:predicted protein [Nematostella vectensis]|uniref:tRNA (32-2'-O)-methyltransferase regulator THADA-like C-terminal TPR repeats region domain-containing protein n=1 Tax=Nematostella vectensis TaxID=45351 RepID=A7SVK4_NEMVE|nr:predicted protein [Nematostella vectensis]|eukprot:XP_001624364.1 predicted protein [Nematostella vectensis]
MPLPSFLGAVRSCCRLEEHGYCVQRQHLFFAVTPRIAPDVLFRLPLIGSLVLRIFGHKQGQQDDSQFNSISARDFFTRFPSLRQFFLRQLRATASPSSSGSLDITHACHATRLGPELFPILSMLSKLRSARTVEEESLLVEFIPLLKPMSSSPVYAVRSLAAQALVPFVPINGVVEMIAELLNSLPVPPQAISQNAIHGTLLQVRKLASASRESSVLRGAYCVVHALRKHEWLGTAHNACAVTREEYLRIVMEIIPLVTLQGQLSSEEITRRTKVLLATPDIDSKIAILEYLRTNLDLEGSIKGPLAVEIASLIVHEESQQCLLVELDVFTALNTDECHVPDSMARAVWKTCISHSNTPKSIAVSSRSIPVCSILLRRELSHCHGNPCDRMVCEWSEQIARACPPDCPEPMRMGAARGLEIVGQAVLKVGVSRDETGNQRLLDACVSVFRAGVMLMEDEEEDIRTIAGQFSAQLAHSSPIATPSSINSSVAMETIFDFMANNFWWCQSLWVTMETMVAGTRRAAVEIEEYKKSRPALFESEDTNQYAEPFVSAQLANFHLKVRPFNTAQLANSHLKVRPFNIAQFANSHLKVRPFNTAQLANSHLKVRSFSTAQLANSHLKVRPFNTAQLANSHLKVRPFVAAKLANSNLKVRPFVTAHLADSHLKREDEAIFSTPAFRKNEDLILLEDSRDVSSLDKSALQSELHRLGMKTSGNKPSLNDLKQAILKSRQKTTIAPDLPSSSSSSSTTQVKPVDYIDLEDKSTCSCQLIVANLKSQTDEIKAIIEPRNIENSTQQTQTLVELREENNKLRAHLSSIQSEISTVIEERDSLKLALLILAKDLHSSPDPDRRATINRPPSNTVDSHHLINQVTEVPTPANYSGSKTQGKKKSKKNKKSNQLQTPTDDNSPDQRPVPSQPERDRRRKVVIAGDSMVKFVKGWELSNSDQKVSVMPFPGAKVSAMDHCIKPIAEQIADSVTDIGHEVLNTSPSTDVIISAIIHRFPRTIVNRSFKNFNETSLLNELKNKEWNDIAPLTDPNDTWEKWRTLFISCLDKHAPLRRKRTGEKSSPWIDYDLIRKIYKRDFLKRKAEQHGD